MSHCVLLHINRFFRSCFDVSFIFVPLEIKINKKSTRWRCDVFGSCPELGRRPWCASCRHQLLMITAGFYLHVLLKTENCRRLDVSHVHVVWTFSSEVWCFTLKRLICTCIIVRYKINKLHEWADTLFITYAIIFIHNNTLFPSIYL